MRICLDMQVYEEELPLYNFQIIGVSWGLKFCTKRSEMGGEHPYKIRALLLYWSCRCYGVLLCRKRDVEGYRVLYY